MADRFYVASGVSEQDDGSENSRSFITAKAANTMDSRLNGQAFSNSDMEKTSEFLAVEVRLLPCFASDSTLASLFTSTRV